MEGGKKILSDVAADKPKPRGNKHTNFSKERIMIGMSERMSLPHCIYTAKSLMSPGVARIRHDVPSVICTAPKLIRLGLPIRPNDSPLFDDGACERWKVGRQLMLM